MSQLTTHILDTALGKPAAGVHVFLYMHKKEEWIELAKGTTNGDGRIPDLTKKDEVIDLGMYRLRFETQGYFSKQSIQTFYPYIEVTFQITTEEHYHVPLLLTPYGYSTYRGT